MNFFACSGLVLFTICAGIPATQTHAQTKKVKQEFVGTEPAEPVPTEITGAQEDWSSLPDSNKPFKYVEEQPQFIGDLRTYLDKNLKYPSESDFPGERGRVIVQFVILTSGLIKDIEVVRPSGFRKCDEEAVRVLQPMKTQVYWKPGRLQGRTVPVLYTIPVTFNRA